MGTWGPGILSDDTARDARENWLDLIREGVPPDEASRRVLKVYGDDEETLGVAALALAAVAWKSGRLDDETKVKALNIIRSGRDLERWADSGSNLVARRRSALEQLRRQLETAQPPPSKLSSRPQRRPEFPAGSVVVVDLGPERVGICRIYHHETRAGPFCIVEPLAWSQLSPPKASELQTLEPLATEPALPSGTGPGRPHRCLVIFKQAGRRDPRMRLVAREIFADRLVGETSGHGLMTVDGWITHLGELYRTGTWSGAPRRPEVPRDARGS